MASSYPSALDNFPVRADGTVIYASHINTLEESVAATQTVLGINPQGGQLTVAARLAALEDAVEDGTSPPAQEIDGGDPSSTFTGQAIDGGTP